MAITPQRRFGRAWLLLAAALGIHVTDEALTGFLSIYNPTVRDLRATYRWLPLPEFTFDVWMTGLALAVAALLALAPLAYRGARAMRIAAMALGVVMMGNAVLHVLATMAGHTTHAVRVNGLMPGTLSSPLLAAAAGYLIHAALGTTRCGGRDVTVRGR